MRMIETDRLTLATIALGLIGGTYGLAAPCAKPSGFIDSPHPAIAPPEQLITHTEVVLIGRSLVAVSAVMNKPLNEALRGSDSLPGVSGDFMLTPGTFGAPGSRHIVCLTDGGRVEEEALEREETPSSTHFRYIVWNYQTPKARPVAYGIGDFRSIAIDGSHTSVTWSYSFRLREDVFPGNLGSLGRFLFRIGFLDREYAAMMRGVLSGYKSSAEGR